MRNILRSLGFTLITCIIMLTTACEKQETDTEKPVISNGFSDAFPINCDTMYFDEDFTVKLLFTDNKELGSYSISMHNNFDHHSHSTEVSDCEMDPEKTPVNPYTFIQDYGIPAGTVEYETDIVLNIPSSNGNGDFDEGDYHFFVNLTDREGWSAQMGLSIKLLKKRK